VDHDDDTVCALHTLARLPAALLRCLQAHRKPSIIDSGNAVTHKKTNQEILKPMNTGKRMVVAFQVERIYRIIKSAP
jgi:hypothetical protein